jgi:hypothetical protein
LFSEKVCQAKDFGSLSDALTEILSQIPKKIVIMIDEVDKSGDNDLFIHFLQMLRDKYISADMGVGVTFQSVILAGVHDVKTLKLKIRPESDARLNSPWNVAADFDIDMSFSPEEIRTMLAEYVEETGSQMDIKAISERLHFWTNGYPFLTSKICKIIDEKLLPKRENKNWYIDDVDAATRILVDESNTLFDDLIKNLENNKELQAFIRSVAIDQKVYVFNTAVLVINIANMYGIIEKQVNGNDHGKVKIHNRIFDELITIYFIGKYLIENTLGNGNLSRSFYLKPDGRLDFDKVLLRFQEFIKSNYSKNDIIKSDEFLEKNYRLVFLSFLQPILNGVGFCFKEAETGEEKRLDVVVVFKDEKFIVELKIWYGLQYHKAGIKQLKQYMETENVNRGYMLIINKNLKKRFFHKMEDGILMVYM